jgi:hypothetical protein
MSNHWFEKTPLKRLNPEYEPLTPYDIPTPEMHPSQSLLHKLESIPHYRKLYLSKTEHEFLVWWLKFSFTME